MLVLARPFEVREAWQQALLLAKGAGFFLKLDKENLQICDTFASALITK